MVFVITDESSARYFGSYQAHRRGQQLGFDDYQALRSVWYNTPAECESDGKHLIVKYPANSPESWWERKTG